MVAARRRSASSGPLRGLQRHVRRRARSCVQSNLPAMPTIGEGGLIPPISGQSRPRVGGHCAIRRHGVISVGALTPILVCFHKLEITPASNFNQSCDGTDNPVFTWFAAVLKSRPIWPVLGPSLGFGPQTRFLH